MSHGFTSYGFVVYLSAGTEIDLVVLIGRIQIMSFSSQSKFNLLRDQRKVANREQHGVQQDDSDQPVGRPELRPPHVQEVQTSRAPSTVGEAGLKNTPWRNRRIHRDLIQNTKNFRLFRGPPAELRCVLHRQTLI